MCLVELGTSEHTKAWQGTSFQGSVDQVVSRVSKSLVVVTVSEYSDDEARSVADDSARGSQ